MIHTVLVYLWICLYSSSANITAEIGEASFTGDSTVLVAAQYPTPPAADELFQHNPYVPEFDYQLNTLSNGELELLLHLKETTGLMTLKVCTPGGRQQLLLNKENMSSGFYAFNFQKPGGESLLYWTLSLNGQRTISFIR
jgi:hypothetical protein